MKEAILLVSDCHVGRVTKDYDVSVFNARMNMLKSNVLTLINEYNIDKLNIFLLGDIVDGEDIYRGHAYEKETTAVDEIDIALTKLSSAIKMWSHVVEIGKICCVKGNHGRSKSGSKTNYDTILYRLLAERLSKVDVRYTDGWYMVARIGRWDYMLTHGDCIRMYNQVPFYGIQRNVLRWRTNVVGHFNCLCIGHFHTVASIDVNGIRVVVNGTMLSGDDYCERMGLMPVNKFVMFGYNERRPITWIDTVDLMNEQ